jgi:hypothetical protein
MNIEITEKNIASVAEYDAAMKIGLDADANTPEFEQATEDLVRIRSDLAIAIVVAVHTELFCQAATAAAAGIIDMADCSELQVMDVDSKDYPDFCDAAFESGYHDILDRELTEDELCYLGEHYPEDLNEAAMESLR